MTGKGYLDDKPFWLFYVDNVNQLSQLSEIIIDYPERKIRVIGYVDRKWYSDPSIEDIRSYWKLWMMGKTTFVKISIGLS